MCLPISVERWLKVCLLFFFLGCPIFRGFEWESCLIRFFFLLRIYYLGLSLYKCGLFIYFIFIFTLWYWGSNSQPSACQAGARAAELSPWHKCGLECLFLPSLDSGKPKPRNQHMKYLCNSCNYVFQVFMYFK